MSLESWLGGLVVLSFDLYGVPVSKMTRGELLQLEF